MMLAPCWVQVSVLVVCVLLAGITEATEVCLRDERKVVPAAVVADHVGFLTPVLVALFVGFLLGSTFGWKAHGFWIGWTWGPSNKFAQARNMATQSQVRYCWTRSEPRFLPLPEREHGAFVDWQLPVHLTT